MFFKEERKEKIEKWRINVRIEKLETKIRIINLALKKKRPANNGKISDKKREKEKVSRSSRTVIIDREAQIPSTGLI